MSKPHIEMVHPPGWPRAKGYAHGVAARGTVVFVAGQIGWDREQRLVGPDLVPQFRQALENALAVVRAAGGQASDIVRLTVYLTDLAAYRAQPKEIGAAYREVMGKHFPPMAFVGVAGLVEPGALVEIEATAVIATPRRRTAARSARARASAAGRR